VQLVTSMATGERYERFLSQAGRVRMTAPV
jgi:hypothetical protein